MANYKLRVGTSVVSPFSSIGFDAQTPEQISIYCPLNRAVATGTVVNVEYRVNGDSGAFSTAHPLLQINSTEVTAGAPVAVVDAFAGAIFDLIPDVTYDVRVTIVEPGKSDVILTSTRATRALPAAAGTPNKNYPAMGGTLQAAFNGLAAGDVLELAAGTYTVSSLTLGALGTSGSPIYIRGASKTGVIIKDTTAEVLTILTGAGHLILENLTIEGSSVDSDTLATSAGIVFGNAGAAQTNVTIRHVNFVGVDRGIKAYETAGVNGCLVYGCEMRGNNTWDKSYFDNDPGAQYLPNLTWNDDGISLPGMGNCAWNNTLDGFGDAFSIKDAVFSSAVYYYRNLIEMTGDDAFEADYSTRNIGFYDNYCGNSSSLLSVDPVWGGPLYCFRNTSINSHNKPFKLTNINSGYLIYNNTILRLDGTASVAGIYMANTYAQKGVSFRNNLIVHRGSLPTFDFAGAFDRVDWTHNSWYAGTSFQWPDGGPYSSPSLAAAGLPSKTTLFGSGQRHSNDTVVTSNPWASTITLGADHTTEYTGMQRLTISSGTASASGAVIPGITDGYLGAAPDRGAEITGRIAVVYGVAGLAGAGVWVSTMPVGTWKNLTSLGTNTLDTCDPDIDPACNPNYFLSPPANVAPWRRAGGHAGIVRAWSGGCFDKDSGKLFLPYPGGHNDGHPNCVWMLDVNKAVPVWTRINNPSGSLGMTPVSWDNTVPPFSSSLAEMSDGRVRAHHTENFTFYWPGLGPGIASEIIIAPGGGFEFGRNRPNIFSPITGERTFLGANKNNEASGGYCSACFDPLRNSGNGGVWKMPSGGSPTFSWWGGPSDDNWHDVGGTVSYSGACSLSHMPTEDIILVGNGGNDLVAGGGSASQSVTGGFQVLDPNTGTLYSPTFTGAPTSAPSGFSTGLWPGNCQPQWSSILGAFLAWDMTSGNTTQIMKITPGANPRTDPWTISYLTVSGSNTVTPSARTDTGTYGRFWVWEFNGYGLCGVINSTAEAGFVFRYA